MDNYRNYGDNNPHEYPYFYTHPNQVHSSVPPIASYPPPPPHYYSPYPPPPPPHASYLGPRPHFHSGPLPPIHPFSGFQDPENYSQPSLKHHGSFQYGSSYFHYSETALPSSQEGGCSLYPSSPDSLSGSNHQRQESSPPMFKASAAYATVATHAAYPPLEDVLHDMSLSETCPSAPALPTATFCQGNPAPTTNYSFSECWTPSHSASVHGSQTNQSLQVVPFDATKGSLRVLLLHGNLDVLVKEAKNLPNMDMFHKTLGDMFGKIPGNLTSKMEGRITPKITSDPYVTISVAGAVVGRTYVISNSENPVWMQHFCVPVAHYAAEVHFVVKDSDVVGSQIIGTVAIPVEQFYSGIKVEGTFPVLNSSRKPCKIGASLTLSIQYHTMEKLSMYSNGVGSGPEYNGVDGTYFPLRKGGNVTLYQDANVPDGTLPSIMLDYNKFYVHGKCWYDIFEAVWMARRLIYIAGWSVWHKLRLIRDDKNTSEYTLGELLKSKSQEGVRILILVWDDPTSRSILGYKTDGIMQTHDEETRHFFKHSSVQVLLCPRNAGKRHSWVKQREVETIYTHHQKTVIVDSDAGSGRRKIIAFVGGLDLCDGRYDTPQHPLFRTSQTLHKDDYHNPSFVGNLDGCPREPWHDLHCKIDSPAAYDVLTNFQERWLKASKPRGIKKLKKSYDDALLSIERLPDIIGLGDEFSYSLNDHESWHVQVFRSIDSNSVKGFPKDPKNGTTKNLVCGKNVLIDMSIHTAYVEAIRSAQHFIYIENQYFIGSSYNWGSHKDLGANNLVPMEIALKIVKKIKARERFAAYIVIPMWPEGVPTGAATQRILFWQNKTMQMMYETIHKALVEVGLEDTFAPQDFLNFFCLGNREAVDGHFSNNDSPNSANTPQALSKQSRRFMIYVHSKGMIVDDEYVILGSANINQRSMEGTRDTEIAMGAYQPHYTWARKHGHPYGQVYGYRMSLWAEHMGGIEEWFGEPEGVECVRRVRALGEKNWKQFSGSEVSEMKSHLLSYPVQIAKTGKVNPIPGHEMFPDVGGNIVGSFIAIQENLTI